MPLLEKVIATMVEAEVYRGNSTKEARENILIDTRFGIVSMQLNLNPLTRMLAHLSIIRQRIS